MIDETAKNIDSSLIAHRSSLKILLWDIDGTLTIAPRTGAYKNYFAPALQRVYGSFGTIHDKLKVSGMTDLQIAFEALESEGVGVERIYERADEFNLVIAEEIRRECDGVENRFVRLPGVREVLTATAANPLFVNGLLTGNVPLAAEYKLKFVGLDGFFDFSLGAFGIESHQRQDLPAIAARNINRKFDYEFAPSQFIIIGDTPNDIACARYFGAKAVSVATGRNHSRETLAPYRPDYIFDDLSNTAEVVRVLSEI